MSFLSLLTFVLISAAQVAIPGPSTVFLVNNSVTFGPAGAIVALSGDLAAIVILASLSAIGVGALLAANEAILLALQLGGAAYLLWLGFGYFDGRHPSPGRTEPEERGRPQSRALDPVLRDWHQQSQGGPVLCGPVPAVPSAW